MQAEAFDGVAVLEVGAGIGLCSLALATFSTATLTATDLVDESLSLMRAAAERSGLYADGAGSAGNLAVGAFDLAAFDVPMPPCDVLVACDVLYTPSLAMVLARRCAEQRARGGHVLVADPGRPTRQAFLAELERLGVPAVAFTPLHEATRLGNLHPRWNDGGDGDGGGDGDDGDGAPWPQLFQLLLVDEHCTPPFLD